MKVTIITVCKNSESTIEKAVSSVFSQTYKEIEYVVVDGASTDRTLDIIREHEDKIDNIISEPDSGIYDAMNKGLTNSSGDAIFFLNADDYFHDDQILADIAEEFSRDNSAGIVYGNVVMFDGSSEKLVKHDNVSHLYFYKNTICHQAVFAKRDIYEEVGNFDEKYMFHADVDWIMRAYFTQEINERFRYIDRNICYYSAGGVTSDPVLAEKYKYDRQEISAKYFVEARIKLRIKKILMKLGLYR